VTPCLQAADVLAAQRREAVSRVAAALDAIPPFDDWKSRDVLGLCSGAVVQTFEHGAPPGQACCLCPMRENTRVSGASEERSLACAFASTAVAARERDPGRCPRCVTGAPRKPARG
jgi:hypothetical protein